LTESVSTNQGITWSPAVNSKFYTTSGPPNLVPMDNGDMVLIWNNATMPPRHNNQVWYGGRDVLHAAISKDGGTTWKGFREIYLDPFRDADPVAGDTGTAYSFATATADNKIIAITGQAAAKTQLRLDPDWLLEKDRSDDFLGPDPLSNWSVFKPYGNVVSVKRSRVAGAALIDDPSPYRTKPVLHIRKPDEKDPDGAAWNFPATARGRTHLRIQLQQGFGGGVIALTDRFFNPTDSTGEDSAFYRLSIAPNGALPTGHMLQPDTWYDLTIDWNAHARSAILRLAGKHLGVVAAQPGAEMWPGLSYLRLRSAATAVDNAGFLIDEVRHVASNLRDATRLETVDAEFALGIGTHWTAMRFDNPVPNPGGGLQPLGVIAAFDSPFRGFLNARDAASGLQIESSTGEITFVDAASSVNGEHKSTDLLGPRSGETLTFRFVDPTDPSRPATVSDVALRLGSVAAGNVDIRLFDLEGNELPDWNFALVPSGVNGAVGFSATEEMSSASIIHRIEISGRSNDLWVLGSFTADAALPDLAIRGFQVAAAVPEPATVGLLVFAAVVLQRRRTASRQ
ncbi:MAG TPA: sialidase family protein, partial [Tepidisphaeraceae bacterium]|nr:sialidase family protein [Tepidisphaeraceae bacterium]